MPAMSLYYARMNISGFPQGLFSFSYYFMNPCAHNIMQYSRRCMPPCIDTLIMPIVLPIMLTHASIMLVEASDLDHCFIKPMAIKFSIMPQLSTCHFHACKLMLAWHMTSSCCPSMLDSHMHLAIIILILL